VFAVQVSGTGHAGMEATIANCLEPGETIVVATSGIWGQRVCDLSERYGGNTQLSAHKKTTVGLAYVYEVTFNFSHKKTNVGLAYVYEVTLDFSLKKTSMGLAYVYEVTVNFCTQKNNRGLAYLHDNASKPAGCTSEVAATLSPVQGDLITNTAVEALHFGSTHGVPQTHL